jgi:hypothetical protein
MSHEGIDSGSHTRTVLIDGECWVPLGELINYLRNEPDTSGADLAEALSGALVIWGLEVDLMGGELR